MLLGDNKYKHPIGVLFDLGEGRKITGQLRLKRGGLFDSNVVSIVDDEFFHVADGGSLHGISTGGMVSVLDCVGDGILGSTGGDDYLIHHGDISFRYALFGKRHITADEKSVRGIEFTLEGVESSVFVHDNFAKFGLLYDPDKTVLDAIERTRPEYQKGAFVKEKAVVSYFTGDHDILPRFETVLGIVHVGRLIETDFLGHIMKGTPRITVDFNDAPTTLEDALGKVRQICQFFAWMMGYALAWKDVLVFTLPSNESGLRADADGVFEMFGPNERKVAPEEARQCGTLIDGSRHPEHFMKVMKKWLERNGNEKKKTANARFSSCFPGISKRSLEDGIVSAANTFDLLPNEDKPEAQPLEEDLQNVLADASKKVKSCMPGTQRDDILTTLGNVQRNKRLRHIIEHRAEIVLEHFGQGSIKQLDKVIGHAVKCRNYYTHGPGDQQPSDIDYADAGVVLFLTQTLEFIYGASELLLCGWEPDRSVVGIEWHPIGGFLGYYDARRCTHLGLH